MPIQWYDNSNSSVYAKKQVAAQQSYSVTETTQTDGIRYTGSADHLFRYIGVMYTTVTRESQFDQADLMCSIKIDADNPADLHLQTCRCRSSLSADADEEDQIISSTMPFTLCQCPACS